MIGESDTLIDLAARIPPQRSETTSSALQHSYVQCGLIAKRAAAQFRKRRTSARQRLQLCATLLEEGDGAPGLEKLAETLRTMSIEHRHYWIGTFYTLLLSKEQRRRQSAYFTRPEIARHLLRILESKGADFRTASILDPAAGGAAFLSIVAGRMKELGCQPRDIVKRIRGIEIDPTLAELSRRLIADRLGVKSVPATVIAVGDALRARPGRRFDIVLANPPYGRVFPKQLKAESWQAVCHPGHINLYALFMQLALKRARVGGHVGLIVPSSFIAGPLYCRLRRFLRDQSDVKVLGQIECREAFFLDVMQDVSLLVGQRMASRVPKSSSSELVDHGRIDATGRWLSGNPLRFPFALEDSWILPESEQTTSGGATLETYGCRATSGYFVWNRETERMTKSRGRSKLCVPLFWACNVRANANCVPTAKDCRGTDYVRFAEQSPAIIRGHSILLQRTTNTKQRRRLIAGLVRPDKQTSNGYVSENHTIVVRPTSADVDLDLVCRLLNSEAVDRRYRQLSGTASVSTLLLRRLDLPKPEQLRAAMRLHKDFEKAVERAYALSAEKSWAKAS
ncbi:MAG: HsdM family class I SAM-dependent methyltransferase [Hyphomicrobium sp.]